MTPRRRGAPRGAGRRRTGLLGAWLLLAAAGCGSSEQHTPPQRVVLLVIDATHAAQLGCYGGPADLTPRIDALAERGRRFTRAMSNATWTLPSTASLMTGRLPAGHGVVSREQPLPDDAVTLAELFAATGWRTASFVQMVYASSVYGFGQGFEESGAYYELKGSISDRKIVGDVIDWLRAANGERAFAYVHLRRPHSPYDPGPLERHAQCATCPLADGARDEILAHADSRVRDPDALTPEEREHIVHLYRANLAAIDDSLHELFEYARNEPDLLLVLTSDHGEGLGQHGHYGHGPRLYAEHIDIPLIVAGSGVEPGTEETLASTIDLLPTLAEWCQLRAAPADVDGHSLAGPLRGEPGDRDRNIVLISKIDAEGVPGVGIRTGNLKLTLGSGGTQRLFDLDADPGERTDIAARRPDLARHLGQLARTERDRHRATPGGDAPVLSPEESRHLEALGYVGGDR